MLVKYTNDGEIIGTITGDHAPPSEYNMRVIEVQDGLNTKYKKVDTQKKEIVNKPISFVKESKIQSIKEQAFQTLSESDWYVIRKQETGEPIPQDVLDHRSKVRSLSDEAEQEINGLDSVGEVMDYSCAFPDPPDNEAE